MPVVAQRDEAVLREETVGGVSVHDVYRARRERLVLHSGSQGTHGLWRETISAAQSREAVGAADEVGGESCGEPSPLTRQVGHCATAMLGGKTLRDGVP